MKIYIAGPMRGKPNFNFAAFHAAQVILEKEGHEVFNPARRDENEHGESMFNDPAGDEATLVSAGFSIRQALRADTTYITLHADAVCVLAGWESSKGACAEVALAHALDLPVYTLSELQLNGLNTLPEETDPLYFSERPPGPIWESGWQPVTAKIGETVHERLGLVSAEMRTVAESGAMKGVKLARFDLIPVKALTEVAKHYGRTAEKYPPNNWRKGYEWSKSYAAIMRHLTAWWDGQDVDVDPAWPDGSPHLAAVAWHALTLLEYATTKTGIDDRPESC